MHVEDAKEAFISTLSLACHLLQTLFSNDRPSDAPPNPSEIVKEKIQ